MPKIFGSSAAGGTPGGHIERCATNIAKEYKLSPQRLKALQDEMNYLKTVREKEVAELIKEARSFGDLSENSEYDEAKNEQGKLYSRMAELEDILSNYVVIEEEEKDGDFIRLGSTVGKALLGHNEGDDITVDAPGGAVKYKILKVER